MARKSYQHGTVKERSYDYGTAYVLHWRERQPDGTWKQRTKTLRQSKSCKNKKTAEETLDKILREINGRNGLGARQDSIRFSRLMYSMAQLPGQSGSEGIDSLLLRFDVAQLDTSLLREHDA